MMDCEYVQEKLDTLFDGGEPLAPDVEQHVESCDVCLSYQQQLEALDGLLRYTAPLDHDPALVARIQEAVACQSRPIRFPRWAGPAIACAVVLVALVGGQLLDTYREVPATALNKLALSEPLLPDWKLLQAEVAEIPDDVYREASSTAAMFSGIPATLSQWLSGMPGLSGGVLGGVCFVGLLLVILLDRSESRRIS